MSLREFAWSRIVLLIALVLFPAPASAQNVLAVGIGAAVRPGASTVVIPITLASVEELTLLRFDLAFSPTLCAQLVDPEGIIVRRAGRTTTPTEEEPVGCQAGAIRVGVLNLDGNAVIPAGTGAVIELALGGLRSGATGTFPLTLQGLVAHRGPRSVALSPSGGDLTIRCTAAADCDDGDACTTDTCSQTGGACIHTCTPGCQCPCPSSPAVGCATPLKGQLRLRIDPYLQWKFLKGPAVAPGGFGNPTTTTSYTFCVYDDGVLKFEGALRPSATPWVALGTKGYHYRDAAGTDAGITQLKLLSGQTGSTIRLTGKGPTLPLPTPVSGSRFLGATASVQAQLHQSDGSCYQTTFAPGQVLRNDGRLFMGRF